MPASYNFSSGGLNLRPIITPVQIDPVEQAIKQAQLYNLQQDPKFKERALTLEQLGIDNTQKNHEALQKLQEGQLAETGRHNVVDEAQAASRLAQETAYQTGALTETTRHDKSTEGLTADEHKTQIISALLAHGLNNIDPKVSAAIPDTLAQLGYPELKTALGSQGPNKDEQMAKLAMEMFAKKNDSTTPVAPFGSVPTQSREDTRPKFNLLNLLRGGSPTQ